MSGFHVSPTMSAADRLVGCPSSFAMVQVHAASPGRDKAADAGTMSHAGAEACVVLDREHGAPCLRLDDGLDPAAKRIVDLLRSWDAYTTALATPGAVLVEASYTLWPGERRAVLDGERLGRAYPKREGAFLQGTADLVLVFEDEIVVVDYKTGHEAPDPATSWQLRSLALAAAQAAAVPPSRVRVAILHAPQDANYASLREWTYSVAELFEFGDKLARSLRALDKAVAEGPNVFGEGDHCRYCPAARVCPAKTAMVHAVTHGDRSLAVLHERATALTLTDADAGAAWPLVREAKRRLEEIEDAIKGMVTAGAEVSLANGKVLKATSTTKKSFSQASAIALLRDLGATDAQIAQLYAESTSTSVREVKAPKVA